MIVITGASGKIGQGIIEALLKRTSPQRIAVSVRDPQKVQHLETQGVRVRRADYSDGASLRHAFEGASQVLMVSSGILGEPGLALHRAAADAAQDVGAGRIVYTSHMAANQHSLFPPMWTHAATEDMLARTGLAFTALRNGFYADSAQFLLGQAAHTGSVQAPQDGPVSWTTHADLAEAAASVLLDEGRFEGPTPPLVGDEALDLAQLGQLLSSLTGTPIQRVVISELDYRQTLATRGLPSERIDVMMGLFTAAARGEFVSQDPTLSTLLAHPPQRMDQVLRQQNAG